MKSVVACLFVAWLCAGCGFSEHPLSDESDSVIDTELLGWWEGEPEKPAKRIVVGRVPGTQRTLEVVGLKLDKNKQVVVERHVLFATQIAGKKYLSMSTKDVEIGMNGAKKKLGKGYMLFRYRIDGDVLHAAYMDNEVLGAQIAAKQIGGKASRTGTKKVDGKEVPTYSEVGLTASKAELRAWIAKAPANLWKPGENTLRKVKLDD